jgi:microtubule-associated protein-like 6
MSEERYPPFMKGTVYPPSSIPDVPNEPTHKLDLEFIYGSSKKGCKGNILFDTKEGKIVYPAAACGVVYDPREHTQKIFRKHDDDVICMAMHPDGYTCATGEMGKDDFVYVWDTRSLDVIAKLPTNKYFNPGGNLALSFNRTGEILAVVGGNPLDSLLLVYNWKDGTLLGKTKCSTKTTFFLSFKPLSDELVFLGKDEIKFFTIGAKGEITAKKGIVSTLGKLQSFYSAVFDDSDNTIVGTKSGILYIFHDNHLVEKRKAHHGAVFCLYQTPDGFISAGSDGKILIWKFSTSGVTNKGTRQFSQVNDINIGGIIRSVSVPDAKTIYVWQKKGNFLKVDVSSKTITPLMFGHSGKPDTELWGLDVMLNQHTFFTGADDGRLIMWDIAKRLPLGEVNIAKKKIRSIAVSPDRGHVLAGTFDGFLYVFDTSEIMGNKNDPSLKIKVSKEELGAIKYSPNGVYVAIASHDNNIYVYGANKGYKLVSVLSGHTSAVLAIDWSADGHFLQSCCRAYEHKYWNMQTFKPMNFPSKMVDEKWASQTTLLGWSVRGMWDMKTYNDGTDINACDVNFKNGLLASVDDFGDVNLFSYPTVKTHPKRENYIGHCSHTTNVRFTSDGTYLLSAGGADMTVFQWKVVKK